MEGQFWQCSLGGLMPGWASSSGISCSWEVAGLLHKAIVVASESSTWDSVWSWFKQILETFPDDFTKSWAFERKLWLFTKFPIHRFCLTAVSHKDTDNRVLITCFNSRSSSVLHLFSVLAELDPCFPVCQMKIKMLPSTVIIRYVDMHKKMVAEKEALESLGVPACHEDNQENLCTWSEWECDSHTLP